MKRGALFFLTVSLFFLPSCREQSRSLSPEVNYAPFQKLEDSPALAGWSKSPTLVYQVMAEPPTLHPTNGNSSPWQEIIQYIHAFLLNIDFHNTGLQPGILSLPEVSADGLRYTYSMRSDARWDDGTPVTRNDILFTLKASACPLTANTHAKAYWDHLVSIEPGTDSLSLTLVMKSQYIQNIGLLAEVPVIQEKFYDPGHVLRRYSLENFRSGTLDHSVPAGLASWAENFNQERYGRDPRFISGLGAYRVKRWEPGQLIELEKKAGYWNNKNDIHLSAHPERIIFKINRDEISQKLEFKSQALDASSTITVKTLLDLCQDSVFLANYHAAVMPTYNYTYVSMNCRPQPSSRPRFFDDVRTRRALAHLLPVEDMIQVVYKSYSPQCRRLAGPVSPMKKECDSTLALVQRDAGEARRLLAAAGWKDTDGDGILDKRYGDQKITLSPELYIMNTSSDWKDMASLAVAACREAGMALQVVSLDPKVFVEKARAHDYDLLLGVWGGTSHAEDYTQLWHTDSWIRHGNNYAGFGNAASDALIDSIKTTLDEEARIGMVRRLQRMIYDEQPMVFLYNSLRRYIVHRRFHGVELFAERPGILLNNLQPPGHYDIP